MEAQSCCSRHHKFAKFGEVDATGGPVGLFDNRWLGAEDRIGAGLLEASPKRSILRVGLQR